MNKSDSWKWNVYVCKLLSSFKLMLAPFIFPLCKCCTSIWTRFQCLLMGHGTEWDGPGIVGLWNGTTWTIHRPPPCVLTSENNGMNSDMSHMPTSQQCLSHKLLVRVNLFIFSVLLFFFFKLVQYGISIHTVQDQPENLPTFLKVFCPIINRGLVGEESHKCVHF